MNSESAREIAEQLLEQSGKGLMEDRFDLLADCIALPLHLETFEGEREVATTAELRQLFDDLRHVFVRIGVTDLVRRVVAAEFFGTDTLRTTHETRILNGNRLLQDSFPVYCEVKRIDGRWRVVSTSLAIADHPEIVRVLTGAPDTSS